jgi:hypothetical protein
MDPQPEYMSSFVELVVQVVDERNATALACCNFGDNFGAVCVSLQRLRRSDRRPPDLETYNEALRIVQKFPAPFC